MSKRAHLNGQLTENLYIKQPVGFQDGCNTRHATRYHIRDCNDGTICKARELAWSKENIEAFEKKLLIFHSPVEDRGGIGNQRSLFRELEETINHSVAGNRELCRV